MLHRLPVSSLCFDCSGQFVLTACDDGKARVWKTKTGECVITLEHKKPLTAALFLRGNNYIITASKDGDVKLWRFKPASSIEFAAYIDNKEIAYVFSSNFGDAVADDNPVVVEQFLKNNIRWDVAGDNGLTPLYIAVQNKSKKVFRLLLKYGHDPCKVGRAGRSIVDEVKEQKYEVLLKELLFWSIRVSNNFVAKDLLESIDSNVIDENGYTCLHLAVVAENVAMVRFLLSEGANPNVQSNTGNTPLHMASNSDSIEVVQALLKNGADVFLSNAANRTARDLAKRLGYHEIARKIGEAEVRIKLLHSYIGLGNERDTKELLDKNGVVLPESLNEKGRSPLCTACAVGHEGLVRFFLRLRVKDNGEGKPVLQSASCKGKIAVATPLHAASENGHTKIVRLLLPQRGTNVNEQNVMGKTALHLAVENTHHDVENPYYDIVEMLLEAGADMHLKDKARFTPLDLVCSKNDQKLSFFFFENAVFYGDIEAMERLIVSGFNIRAIGAKIKNLVQKVLEAPQKRQTKERRKALEKSLDFLSQYQ